MVGLMAGNVRGLAMWRHPRTPPPGPKLIKDLKDDDLFQRQNNIRELIQNLNSCSTADVMYVCQHFANAMLGGISVDAFD
jgi:hypothetical protein